MTAEFATVIFYTREKLYFSCSLYKLGSRRSLSVLAWKGNDCHAGYRYVRSLCDARMNQRETTRPCLDKNEMDPEQGGKPT